jgi:hypothetical protein
MLITFKSEADSDVIMFGTVGQHMLNVMGKDALDVRGIVTVTQLPAAIASLQSAIEADRASARRRSGKEEGDAVPAEPSVSFATRAVPLLTLLQRAERDKVAVIWEST